jgi:hypothetical protein
VVQIDAGRKDLQQAQNFGDHNKMGEELEVDQIEVDWKGLQQAQDLGDHGR